MEKNLLPIRQQALEFVRSGRWQQLPKAAQRDCQQFLSRLLKDVLASERNDDDDERENQ
jgi:hypothetical protein